ITMYILWNVVKRLKETLFIFLQGVPKEINLDEIRHKLLGIPKVASMHHTHIWSLEGEYHVFTAHIKLQYITEFKEIVAIKQEVKNILKEYSFEHYTIETELDDETCEL